MMSKSMGIPLMLLREVAQGNFIVSVELRIGKVYCGALMECENDWNLTLENITHTAKDGKVSQLEHTFIRGRMVRYIIMPEMFQNAPLFKRVLDDAKIQVGKGSSRVGVGRGRASTMHAEAH